MTPEPYIPPHWPKGEPFPWPEWEAACPGCGRFHHYWHFSGGELSVCAFCRWQGYIPLVAVPPEDE